MGSPRRVGNRRRRTREGPESACVQTSFTSGVAHTGGGGDNERPVVAPSSQRAKTSSSAH